MEYITIFGDIHGNLPALQAVLKDMDEREAENRFCLGDLVGYGTFPNEVTQAIRESGIPTIMGNYDQGIGESSDECGCAYRDEVSKALGKSSIAWTNQHTTPENKAFLRSLVKDIPLQLGELKVLLVHGSPRKINEYLYEDRPESSLERLMDQAGADVLVCGHTHIPYQRVLSSGRHVINAGSVGKPKDHDPRACYVILEVEGRELNVRFVRVEYDIEQTATAIEASEMPDEYAGMLRAGAG
ncbi:MAG: metallophosphoesterase family protein [Anaerolineales bacterium]|jgi:putative phosphoesterase